MKKGFSLIELLIVVAFLVILMASVGLSTSRSSRDVQYLGQTSKKVASLLREAQSRAVSQSENADWGVRFEMNSSTGAGTYSLYHTAYSLGTRREFVTIPFFLRFDTSTFAADDTLEILFSGITGYSSVSTSITIISKNDTQLFSVISVASSGLVSY